MKFLEFILTAQGIKPDLKEINYIHDFPTTNNVEQLRGFLGLIHFYSKFSDKHAGETVPLLKLINKGVTWKWDQEAQKSFSGSEKELLPRNRRK